MGNIETMAKFSILKSISSIGDNYSWSVIKRQMSQTTSDYEWLQVRLKETTCDYKWLRVTTSQATSDYELLQVTVSDYESRAKHYWISNA